MKSTRQAAKSFWEVAEHFHGRGDRWAPVNAGYELGRVVDVEGMPWTVCFKVHVVRTDDGGRSPLRFKSSVTVWPSELSRQEEARMARVGWFRRIEQALHRAGYHGKWSRSPQGRWADFWKDLPNVGAVRSEAKRLETLELAAPRLRVPTPQRGRSRRGT